jgi:hypothetical protein
VQKLDRSCLHQCQGVSKIQLIFDDRACSYNGDKSAATVKRRLSQH